MKKSEFSLKQLLVTGGALFVSIAAPIEAGRLMGYDASVISAAVAEESHAGKATSKGTKGGAGSQSGGRADKASGGNQGASGQGSKSTEALLKGEGGSTTGGKGGSSSAKGGPTADSDAPDWAGVKGGKSGGGGKPAGGGTKKGDLYGDLYVLIRDPVSGIAETETLMIEGLPVVYVKVQAYTKDATGALILLPNTWIPRDPLTGDLLTTMVINNVVTPVFPSEVEFGRLSVSRSPTKVSDHSLAEALTTLNTTGAVVTQDSAGRLVITTTVDGVSVSKTIDSPLENLALYKAIVLLPTVDNPATSYDDTRTVTAVVSSDGGKVTTPVTYTIPNTINIDMLKASLLAAAADKTKTVTLDVLMYMNAILFPSAAPLDLTTFTYDRVTTYGTATATVLVLQPDGVTYKVETVNLYDTLFKTPDTTATGAADFAQAVDDALQILEFIHDNEVR